MKSKKNTKKVFSEKIPLWTQLFVIMTLVFSLMISYILARDYQKNRDSIINQKVSDSHRILELELHNLEEYVLGLASFCIQPRHDTEFLSSIVSKSPLTSTQQEEIKNLIQTYYFSRSDLNSYEIYFCHQDQTFGRLKSSQHVTLLGETGISETEGFLLCSEGNYYNAIMPSEGADSFFDYYQAIIRIKDQIPEAVVRLEIDTSFADYINMKHQNRGEIFCIYNNQGDLLYSGDETLIFKDMEQTFDDMPVLSTDAEGAKSSENLTIDGNEYLAIGYTGAKYGLKMISFLPMSILHEEISSILKSGIMFGIGVWIAALSISFILIRLTMKPLRILSSQMAQVGDGNFQKVTHIGGSQEITELSESFNDMIEHIERLIEQSYVAEINEKTLRLTALEAQLNPHFLYNTLQAIGTEALINDQPQINEMITSLASNLRYSIKGGDLVSLKAEMTYVKNYILLQKVRLEDRLMVELDVEDGLEDLQIPKISIQTLVENSIIHGMGPDSDSIAVQVLVRTNDDFVWISVVDNGCGIVPEQLHQMQKDFQDYLKPGMVGKIGLANLYSRLQILYQGEAALEINSTLNVGTTITMKIPLERRSVHVQSIDRR